MNIKIDLKIFLIIIVYFFTRQIREFSLMLVFIFVHELGHLITGIALGLKPKKIKFTLVGFCVEFCTYNRDKRLNKLIIDMAGPLVNLIIVIIGFCANLQEIVYINILIILINIMIIYPLDGGRILKNIISYKNDFLTTEDIMHNISNITLIIITIISSIAILYLKNIAIVIFLVYLWGLVIKENRRYNLINRMYRIINNNII